MTRSPSWRSTLVHAVILVAAGIAVGAVNNLTAGKTRHLAWVQDYPDKPKKPAAEPVAASPGSAAPTLVAPDTATPAPVPTPDPMVAPAPGAVASDPAAAGVTLPPPNPSEPYVDIAPEQARLAYDMGALFLDARRTSVYEEGHVQGALPMSVWESDVDSKIAELGLHVRGDVDAPIVVYCAGGDCTDSHMLAEKLWGAGYTNVLVYLDGYPDWQGRGWPVATGGQP